MSARYNNHKTDSGMPGSSSSSSAANETSAAGRFPMELYRMLNTVSSIDLDGIVCWQTDGKSFMIHSKPQFERDVMPIFFQRLKYSSFKRLLHLHGFKSVSQRGKEKGAFLHPAFLKDREDLLSSIQKSEKKRPAKKRASKQEDPELQPAPSPTATSAKFSPASTGKSLQPSTGKSAKRKPVGKMARARAAFLAQELQAKGRSAGPPAAASIANLNESTHQCPQNDLHLLLAPESNDVSATAAGAVLRDPRNHDCGHNRIPPSFLALATNLQQPMLGVPQGPQSEMLLQQQMLNESIPDLQQQQQQLLQRQIQLQSQLQSQESQPVSTEQFLQHYTLQQLMQLHPVTEQVSVHPEFQPQGVAEVPSGNALAATYNASTGLGSTSEMMMDIFEPRPFATNHIYSATEDASTSYVVANTIQRNHNSCESKDNESAHIADSIRGDISLQNHFLQQSWHDLANGTQRE